MALILVQIKDQPDGSVAVSLIDEPSCTPDQTEFTPAQHIGATALNAIHQQLNAIGTNSIDLSAAPSTKAPKLVVVGQDEVL